ncbi:MAG: hypothetical protein ACI9WL_001287, partial [Rubritalea sp.]
MATINNRILLKFKKSMRKHFPLLLPVLLKVASRTVLFKAERAYLLGNKRESDSKLKSVVLLSQPRGGTQICEQVISSIYQKGGGETLNIGKFFFWYDNEQVKNVCSEDWTTDNLETSGFFYGNFGAYDDVSKIPKLKYIVMCRDPRDVLLSHYFSVKDAHLINSKKSLGRSQDAQKLTVDEYVLMDENISDVMRFMDQTIAMLSSDHDFLFIRYEDMMAEPQ